MNKKKSPSPQAVPARERILRTAQDLFYQHGVRATGIDRIIAEAQVTKVTFYRHFHSKDDLVEAFLERRHQLWITWFRSTIDRSFAALTPSERRDAPLTPVLSAAKELFTAKGFRGCAFANTVAEFGSALPSILPIASQHKREVAGIIATLLREYKNADKIAWAAALALDGAIVNAQTGAQSLQASLHGLQTLLEALTMRAEHKTARRN